MSDLREQPSSGSAGFRQAPFNGPVFPRAAVLEMLLRDEPHG